MGLLGGDSQMRVLFCEDIFGTNDSPLEKSIAGDAAADDGGGDMLMNVAKEARVRLQIMR